MDRKHDLKVYLADEFRRTVDDLTDVLISKEHRGRAAFNRKDRCLTGVLL